MDNKERLKNIQRDYYAILDNYFQDFKSKYDPTTDIFEYVKTYLKRERYKKIDVPGSGSRYLFNTELNNLFDDVYTFWENNIDDLREILNSLDYLTTQVGEVNHHAFGFNEACTRLGLYFDSICLIDPIFCGAESRNTRGKVYDIRLNDFSNYQVLESLIILDFLKPLVFSDTDIPIAFLAPPGDIFVGDDSLYLKDNTLNHALTSAIFSEASGFNIESFYQYKERFAKTSIGTLSRSLDKHKVIRNLMNNYDGISCVEYANEFLHKMVGIDYYLRKENIPDKFLVLGTLYLLLSNTFDNIDRIEVSATYYNVDHNIPFYDWELYKFRVESISKTLASHGLREELPIQRAIMTKEMDWYTATTVEELIKLREKGLMQGLRDIYKINRNKLRAAKIGDVDELSKEIVINVEEALQNVAMEIENFEDEKTKKSIMLIPKVLMGILPFLYPELGIISLISGGASLSGLINEYNKISSKREKLLNKPATYMLGIWERTKNYNELFNQ